MKLAAKAPITRFPPSVKFLIFPTTKKLLLISLILYVLGLFYILNRYLFGEVEFLDFISHFNLNDEFTAPAIFSAFMLFYSSFLLKEITRSRQGCRDYFEWLGLSLTFFYLAIDEAVSLHERTGRFATDILGLDKNDVLYRDSWVFVGMAFVAIFLSIYLRFLKNQNEKIRYLFLLSAGVYILGALGLEIVGGYWEFFQGKDIIHAFISGVEELLEMLGIVLFINTLLGIIEEAPQR